MAERETYNPFYPSPSDYRYGSPGYQEAKDNATMREALAQHVAEERRYAAAAPGYGSGGAGGWAIVGVGVAILFAIAILGDLSRATLARLIAIIEGIGAGQAGGLLVATLAVAGVTFVSNKLGGALLFIIGFGIFAVGCPTPLNIHANGAPLTWSLFAVCVALFTSGYLLMKRGRWFVGVPRGSAGRRA